MLTKAQSTVLRLFVLALLTGAPAWAQVLLINVADPSAVTITGTGAFAANNFDSGTNDAFPVRITGFFATSQTNFDVLATSTSLMTTGADHTLGRAFLRVGAGGPTTLLLRKDGNSQEDYSTASAAFSGSAVFDLSAYAGVLPAAGASGSIYASDGTTYVGSYSVVSAVPEPSAYAAMAGVGALLVAWRRQRTRGRSGGAG